MRVELACLAHHCCDIDKYKVETCCIIGKYKGEWNTFNKGRFILEETIINNLFVKFNINRDYK